MIGGNVTLLPGVTIGRAAVVGAGSVVTKDVAAGVTVVRHPASEVEGTSSAAPMLDYLVDGDGC